jgi:hypothetical protein
MFTAFACKSVSWLQKKGFTIMLQSTLHEHFLYLTDTPFTDPIIDDHPEQHGAGACPSDGYVK